MKKVLYLPPVKIHYYETDMALDFVPSSDTSVWTGNQNFQFKQNPHHKKNVSG